MASTALDWALANGMSQAEFDKRIFNTVRDANAAGTSPALLRIEMDRLGISAEDVARATGVSTQSVVDKYNAAIPKTEAELIANAAADAELAARAARDTTATNFFKSSRALDATTSAGLLTDAQRTAATQAQGLLVARQNEAALALQQNNAAYAEQQRLNNLAYAEQQRLNNLASDEQKRLNKIKSDEQIAANNAAYAEQQRLNNLKNQEQIATNQKAYEAYLANQAKLAGQQGGAGTGTGTVTGTGGLLATTGATSVTGTTPFANATQGFEQNFRNYTSIPIGAQYNPNVVGGTGSPYAQVMGQMRPVGNPYANVVAGQAMGGYNPGLYDQIAAANLARDIAAKGGTTLADYYGGGPGDATSAAAAATAADSAAAAAASATGTAPGSDGTPGSGAAMGGLITRVFGPDPAGPDEGQVNMMRGEYVIKKSSVNKYGKGLLDMINEGKVPAKKMKSLLG